jgi:hypothetical protein
MPGACADGPGTLDLSDAIALLSFLFLAGPAAPGDLGCQSYGRC